MKFAVFCPIVLLTIVAILDTKFVQAVPIARTPGKDSLFADSDVAKTVSADPLSLVQLDDTISADESEKLFYLGQLSKTTSTDSTKKEEGGKKGGSSTLIIIICIVVAIVALCGFVFTWYLREKIHGGMRA